MRIHLSMRDLKEKQKLAWEGMFYSTQRMDLLVISICGAGIYICLETIRNQNPHIDCISPYVKIAGVFFLVGIILNFLSQIYGYKTHKYDYLMYQSEIDAGDKISKSEQENIDEYDNKSEKASKHTNRLNYSSMIAMSIGLILIMIYFLFIF